METSYAKSKQKWYIRKIRDTTEPLARLKCTKAHNGLRRQERGVIFRIGYNTKAITITCLTKCIGLYFFSGSITT